MLGNYMDCTDIMTLAGEGTVGRIGPHIFYLTYPTLETAPEALLLQYCIHQRLKRSSILFQIALLLKLKSYK